MRRRHIALQPTPEQWHYAVASGDTQEAALLQSGSFMRTPEKPLAEQLSEIVGPLQMTDRLAYALPASCAMVRWLEFPFSDARKIAATAQPEMSRQLPKAVKEQAFFQQLVGDKRALTVAVDKQRLEETIDNFDDNREPLGYLGLTPFCYASGLDWSNDGLLLCATDDEVSIARCENGQPVDLRTMPRTTAAEQREIIQQTLLLARSSTTPLMNVQVLGTANTSELAQELQQAGFSIVPLQLKSEQGLISDELASTACLALAACKADSNSLNLRSGAYKLKNDWQVLKRRMWLAAGLLVATLLMLIGNASLQYRQRAGALEQLQQQMDGLYRQEFPGEKLVAPAPLLLQSKIKELQKRTSQFGTGTASALQLLLAVSQGIAPELSVDIKEYLFSEEGLRLTGTTTNFDTVSKLLASLQREELFREVRILDSKQALDGSQVDFQLQIQLGGDQ